MDLNGLSDPFVKIHFGSERKRTTVVRKNLNPVWNESFKFEVPSLASDLISREVVVEVWDWDRVGRDDFIGQRIWILEQLPDKVVIEDWFELRPERVDVEAHVKILQALHQSGLRRRARDEEIIPYALMIAESDFKLGRASQRLSPCSNSKSDGLSYCNCLLSLHRERRMSILNAKRRRIFREKQKIIEAGWASVLDENARPRVVIQEYAFLISVLIIEIWFVLWTIILRDL